MTAVQVAGGARLESGDLCYVAGDGTAVSQFSKARFLRAEGGDAVLEVNKVQHTVARALLPQLTAVPAALGWDCASEPCGRSRAGGVGGPALPEYSSR